MVIKSNSTPTVYSTDHGRICPDCGKPATACSCRQKKVGVPGDGVVRVGRQTKGRKGKGVTIVSGAPLGPAGLQALAKELKKRCGSGGTVKEGLLEIQGDHRDLVVEELEKRGWKVKKSGG
jgi:translation initiation factor 1